MITDLRKWADGFRHAADNQHYHLDPTTARETATRFDQAAEEVERLRDQVSNRNEVIGDLMEKNAKLREFIGLAVESLGHYIADVPPDCFVPVSIQDAKAILCSATEDKLRNGWATRDTRKPPRNS